VAALVTSAVSPFGNVPTARRCVLTPTPVLDGLGSIEMDCSLAVVTVSVVLPDTDPDVAVIAVEPGATPVATPEAVSTFAIEGTLEFQVTMLLTSAVLVSLKVPVALSC